MLSFSKDPTLAERQMEALIFSLTTFGYIDGDFDDAEKELVKQTIHRLVEHRVDTGMPDATPDVRRDLVERFATHFVEKFEQIDGHVDELFHEPVAKDEERDTFVHAKLKQRCFELFQGFDRANQEALLESVDELIRADGELHPAELKFRGELAALLETEVDVELLEDAVDAPRASIEPPTTLRADTDHPFFQQFEFHYSADPDTIEKQVAADLELVDRLVDILEKKRADGAGGLEGRATVDDLAPGASFLDGWTHVLMPQDGKAYELTVLGDLHGCYSCLKGAVMQTRFFEKVEAFRQDPENAPHPKLVLLGDYIDRGMFSLNGVLRTVMQMATRAPDHVYVLRGNHEYYVEHRGQIYGGVRPAEAINTLKPHLPVDVFRRYAKLFDLLPNVLLFDRAMFVHGGIPRSRLIKERWKDLSSLNDPDARFQMMWSDPSAADVIPAALQEQTARFPFGKLQFASFMQRLGCHTLVRGHEKVQEGFRRIYDDDAGLLITLFSAGGADNRDLPPQSSYRSVTPMAMSMRRSADGETSITPFAIDWESYNDPERNAFHRRPPEIEHRME
ncbi:MAG TPA: metallophosphoesterase family protein [Sandaracinaceae bacterium LLY-WYZ-13_1]|nr:metallophosphoesterase family protein [Sandaracinaceae bacterium LLY-WYZ-13_1]